MSPSRKLSVSLLAMTLCVAGVVAPRSMASPHVVRAVPHGFASAIGSASTSTSTSTSTSASTATAAGSYTSRVVGTFGRAGTVRGHFVPLRSIVRSGTTYVAGNLTTTLRRGDGTLVGRVTRHDVQLPVAASGAHTAAAVAAICPILHLVLGPLNLNLLGLVVHLNRVVLDITAVSGPGNLLGNLLCAVAGLLNNTPTLTNLLMLANLLNRIIGLLT